MIFHAKIINLFYYAKNVSLKAETSNLYEPARAEPFTLFAFEDVAQLVRHDFRRTDPRIDIFVRMPVYPIIYPAAGYEILQFVREGVDQRVSPVAFRNGLKRRDMVGGYHDMLRAALRHALLYESQAFLVFGIEVRHGQAPPAVKDLPEVVHPEIYSQLVLRPDMGPQRRKDEIRIVDPDHLVVMVADVGQKHAAPRIPPFGDISVIVELVVPRNQHHLPVSLGQLLPEIVLWDHRIVQIKGIPRQDQDVPGRLERMAPDEAHVLAEFQMYVRSELDAHITIHFAIR